MDADCGWDEDATEDLLSSPFLHGTILVFGSLYYTSTAYRTAVPYC
jgi:hypothetical protein